MSENKVETTFSHAEEQYRWSTKLMQESRHWTGRKRTKNLENTISILQEIEISLRGLKSTERGINFRARIVFGLLNYEIGMLYLKLMKPTEAESSFQKAWNIIKNHASKPECIILTICLLFEISILYSKRNEPEKSFAKLQFARLQHQHYEYRSNPPPVAFDDLFLNKEQREVKKTSNLFKNHSIYHVILKGTLESLVNYAHADLKDRLKSHGCNMIKWSMDCVILSTYFIEEENFKVARHILTSASEMIVNCEKPPKTATSEESNVYILVKSFISYCWAMYALRLLTSSQRKLKEDVHLDAVSESTKLTDSYETYCLCEDSKVKEKENEFICMLPSSFDEAKEVFVFGLGQVNLCENIYTASDYPSECMNLVLCKAILYGMLARFETDGDRRCKMHKRQIFILGAALEKFNCLNHLRYRRKLYQELARVYGIIAPLKWNSYYACRGQMMTYRNVEKVNHYVNESIQYHQSFIDSFKTELNQMPEIFPNDSVKAILFSYYTMADLYLRITTDRVTSVEYLQKSKKILQFIVNYAERNPSHKKYIEAKFEYIKESILLIPNKIEEIQREGPLLEMMTNLLF